jgi:DNA polymerase III epsilon subunit-like protein
MNNPWQDQPWLVYDLETTGSDPETAMVVQVGAALFEGYTCKQRFATLINPECDIPAEATEIHGITDKMVKDAPTIQQFGGNFCKWAKGFPVLMGYNNLGYDSPILERLLQHRWRQVLHERTHLDVLTMIRMDDIGRYWRGTGRHKLTAVVERFAVELPGISHDAAVDALATGLVLCELLDAKKYAAAIEMVCPADGQVATKQLAAVAHEQQLDYLEYLKKKGDN